ncbi:MAG: translation initiation factor IF-2 [Clostridia bacterium]|nr:translation initiation factor IF-2 [Clostridia bacterium]MBN2882339.1 translation initiation factor IF-2 [Clostridia bacterium]
MKKKISELARELDVKPGIILKKVRDLGISAFGVASEISETDQYKLLESMGLRKRAASKNIKISSVGEKVPSGEKASDGPKTEKTVKTVKIVKTVKPVKQAHSMDIAATHNEPAANAAVDESAEKPHKLKVTVIRKHKSEDNPEDNIEGNIEGNIPEISEDTHETVDEKTQEIADVDEKSTAHVIDTEKSDVIEVEAEPQKPEEVITGPGTVTTEETKVVAKPEVKPYTAKKDGVKPKKPFVQHKELKPLGLTGRKIDLTPKKPVQVVQKKETPEVRQSRPQRPQNSGNIKPRTSENIDKDIPDEKPLTKISKIPSKRISPKEGGRYVQQEFKPPAKKTKSKSGKYKKDDFTGGGIRKVNEVLSEDFVLNEYYSDDNIRQRRSKRKAEHMPRREVLTRVRLPETMTVKFFAETIKKQATDVIGKLMSLDIMTSLNDDIDFDTASLVAEEYGITAELFESRTKEDILFDDDQDDAEESLIERAPVVVVMGHVDHGKTSLLDTIKNTDVVATEAGAITQHVGAYNVHVKNRTITFLDTPGHAAFTSMRRRGAQVTDIAIIVVAADDGIMPQTVEALNHAKDAGVSIIVAINKIDLPAANPDKVKQELTEYGVVPEEWGGDVICVPVSAKSGENIDTLLDMILLTADVLELKANPQRQAKGTVIESKLDEHKGVIATLLVQKGTLKLGDCVISGTSVGRVRAMKSVTGDDMPEAGPSMPAVIMGLDEVPESGETFYAVEDEKIARNLAAERKYQLLQQRTSRKPTTLDELFEQIQEGSVKELKIIVKADVRGSVEAVTESLEKLSNEEVTVKVIHGATGTVNESDINLAEVSNAIIIGFNIRPSGFITKAAEDAGVDIRLYRIIYNAVEEVEAAMKGLLDPKFKEVVTGHAEIRQIFKVSGLGTIGGCMVTDGRIKRNSDIRVVREGIVVYEGRLASLKRFTDDVKEVQSGYECGMSVEKYNDIKESDVIEAFEMVEIEV